MCGQQVSTSREVVATSKPRQIFDASKGKGFHRGEAVASYMRQANRRHVEHYELASALTGSTSQETADFQAAAAATELAANIIEAAMAGDAVTLAGVLELFVNDAVDTGVVTL